MRLALEVFVARPLVILAVAVALAGCTAATTVSAPPPDPLRSAEQEMAEVAQRLIAAEDSPLQCFAAREGQTLEL